MSTWKEQFDAGVVTDSITKGVNEKTIDFAKDFGEYLVNQEYDPFDKRKVTIEKLTTNQVRKFFGEVKRQQMVGGNRSTFVLLKPKLAYAVGRIKKKNKIRDFYNVLSAAIDTVIKNSTENELNKTAFKNFIDVFEAIVAYHKYAEAGNTRN